MHDQIVERFEDMSPRGVLQVIIQEDGDVIVCGIPGSLEDFNTRGLYQSAEFCTIGAGGGQSPHTRQALLDLFRAMELDNKEHPQNRR